MNTSRESSITVAVRVRPFTVTESSHLLRPQQEPVFLGDASLSGSSNAKTRYLPKGIRKILNVVDDRMLIFDPSENNPLNTLHQQAFPNGFGKGPASRMREQRFIFDKLFDESCTQQSIYENTTKPLLDSILDGYNATVFAYGATGCGKTHTISGVPQDPGIIFLTMRELFSKIEEQGESKHFDVSLSYLEIYNETIRDLLQPDANNGRPLMLREDANKRMLVSNLSTHKPVSVEQVMEMILLGNSNRTVSPTEANATSSRSHAVLQINVVQRSRVADINENHTFATLSIIDLAGSERAAATKNRGVRLSEGANINKSLLALGNCINALCDPRRRNHVPYRDSKLTRLLKFSLGGNCKTVMIVCVSPSSHHFDETLNTLKYANRAKEIKTKVVRNQHSLTRHVGSYLKMITEQKQEIEALKIREEKVVSHAVEKALASREKVHRTLMNEIETLQHNLNSKHQDKWNKAYMLTRLKFLNLCKHEMEHFFQTVPHNDETSALREAVESQISIHVKETESFQQKETGLDLVLSNLSTDSLLRQARELETWNEEHDAPFFETQIAFLKSAVERDILAQSSEMFDKCVGQLSFAKVLTSIVQDASSATPELAHIETFLEQGLNLVISQSMIPRLQQGSPAFSKIINHKRLSIGSGSKKQSPSGRIQKPQPHMKSPSLSKVIKGNKKVRWDIEDSSDVVMEEDDQVGSLNDRLQASLELPDNEFEPKPLHLSAMNDNAKNSSLTSKKLVPSRQQGLERILGPPSRVSQEDHEMSAQDKRSLVFGDVDYASFFN